MIKSLVNIFAVILALMSTAYLGIIIYNNII